MPDDPKIPHNSEAERAVLGACLVNPAAIDQAAAVLDPGDFWRDAHARIWRAIRRVHADDGAVDLLTVRDGLERADDLEAVGGSAYVASLTDGVPRSTNVEHYARIVRRCRLERELLTAAARRDVDAIQAAADALHAVDASADPASVAPFVDVLDAESGSMIPEVVLPGLAWQGAMTVIGGEAKAGKSTLIGHGIGAMLTNQPFLGKSCRRGLVAIVTEEPLRLAAARLRQHGIGQNQAQECFLASAGARGILAALRRLQPTLLVIDSFTAFAVAAGADSMSDPVGMRRVLNDLRALAEAGAAVLLVHHARKSDGKLADSRDIGASVDVILDFTPVDQAGDRCQRAHSTRRLISAVGRWPVDSVMLDFADNKYSDDNDDDDDDDDWRKSVV